MNRVTLHDAKIDKPPVDIEGKSDPVVVFTTNNLILVAWWDERTGWWNCIEANNKGFSKETFGDVLWWHEVFYPYCWHYDKGVYS